MFLKVSIAIAFAVRTVPCKNSQGFLQYTVLSVQQQI